MGDELKIRNYTANNARRQFRKVRKIIVHEKFNATQILKYNVALLILEQPFVPTATFSPVNVTDIEPVDNETCRVGK